MLTFWLLVKKKQKQKKKLKELATLRPHPHVTTTAGAGFYFPIRIKDLVPHHQPDLWTTSVVHATCLALGNIGMCAPVPD